jgi:GNAT superfamily N-acetyltransferase
MESKMSRTALTNAPVPEAAGRRGRTDDRVRVARIEDRDEIGRLAESASRELCAADYSGAQIASMLRFGLLADAQMIGDGTCCVIEHRGRIIATGGWSFRAALMGGMHPDYVGGPWDVLDPRVHPARLRGFFVEPRFARLGLGRMIVAGCERAAWLAGFRGLELMATEAGRRFFLACGFAELDALTNIYPDGAYAMAYRMSKTLAVRPATPATTRR